MTTGPHPAVLPPVPEGGLAALLGSGGSAPASKGSLTRSLNVGGMGMGMGMGALASGACALLLLLLLLLLHERAG